MPAPDIPPLKFYIIILVASGLKAAGFPPPLANFYLILMHFVLQHTVLCMELQLLHYMHFNTNSDIPAVS